MAPMDASSLCAALDLSSPDCPSWGAKRSLSVDKKLVGADASVCKTFLHFTSSDSGSGLGRDGVHVPQPTHPTYTSALSSLCFGVVSELAFPGRFYSVS